MKKDDKQDNANVYRVGKLTVLQIMAVLATIGLISTWVLRSYFAT